MKKRDFHNLCETNYTLQRLAKKVNLKVRFRKVGNTSTVTIDCGKHKQKIGFDYFIGDNYDEKKITNDLMSTKIKDLVRVVTKIEMSYNPILGTDLKNTYEYL